MPLMKSVLSWLTKKRLHQIDLFIKYPHEVQQEWFSKLLATAKDTEWGRKYKFSEVCDVDTFKKRLPLQTYEDLSPYIQRMRKGEQNILWPSEIKWFAKSSGTTSDKSKFIPVSQECLEECHFKGGKDMVALYVNNNPDTQIFTGRSVGLGGSHKINEISNEAYYDGDVSAIIIQNLPFWAEFIRVPNRSIALMDEWEEKIEKMARATMQHDVSTLSGVPSWMLLLLRRILEITDKKNIKEVWPNLEVYFHGGVNFDPYRQQFKDITSGSGINYMETYNASEGFFGIQDQPDSRELLLMLDYGVFYEFMPTSELDKKDAKTYQLHEVEKGINYAMIISTNSGLWRYMIGDTIEFTSLNPFRIKISGRTKNFINAVGEELIVDNAEKAMLTATRKCQAVVNEYTAAPVYFGNNSNAAHQWFIEFKQAPENLDYFIDTFDNALKSLNSDYEAKRYQNMILRRPIVESLPEGSFYKWLKSKGKLGGQYKVPRLSNDRKLATELTNIINNT